MKDTHFPSSFAFSTVSTSFPSNSVFRHKRENSSFSTKSDFDQPRIYVSEKTRLKKDEPEFFRKSLNYVTYDQSASPPANKNKYEPFLRNTSYFSVSNDSSPTAENRLQRNDCVLEREQVPTLSLKTCSSIENGGSSNYQKLLEKIHKKARLIDQLKELSKMSVTDMMKHSPTKQKNQQLGEAKQPLQEEKQQPMEHKRGYHSQPNKGKNQTTPQYKPVKIFNAAETLRSPQSPPISQVRERFKTQQIEGFQFDQFYDTSKNPERDSKKIDYFKKTKWPHSQQNPNEALFNLSFTKTQSFSEKQTYKGDGLYTSRYQHQTEHYIAPSTARNNEHKKIADIRHLSDCKRIKNNVNYFTHKVSILDFKLCKTLGSGKFGTVYQAFHRETGSVFALKKIPKKIIKQNMMTDQLVKEIKIQSMCQHQNILQLFAFFDDHDFIYLILEYMDSGTLFQQLKKQKCFSEQETAKWMRHVAKAVVYMHEHGIAHRDIKPENIVVSSGVGKLCDFGWATLCDGDRRKTYCGTFDYAAPEIVQGAEYDMSVDLWCLGVLAYELLVGKAPFFHMSRKETMKKIMNVEKEVLQFPPNISSTAVSFIQGLLRKNPEERLRGAGILSHPFLLQRKQWPH